MGTSPVRTSNLSAQVARSRDVAVVWPVGAANIRRVPLNFLLTLTSESAPESLATWAIIFGQLRV